MINPGGVLLVAGVDEAGRGPLAGQVLAGAVILDPGRPIAGLADSKTLTPVRREELAVEIRAYAIAWAVASATVEEIDRLNILQASLLAMTRAVAKLVPAPLEALIDGNHVPRLGCTARAIVRGDVTEPAISAASILAKVARDAEMCALDRVFPGYDFTRHKGYPTPQHLAALERCGVSPAHRRSFGPVRRLLVPQNARG